MRIDVSKNYMLFRFFNRYGTQLDSYHMVPKVKTMGKGDQVALVRRGPPTVKPNSSLF